MFKTWAHCVFADSPTLWRRTVRRSYPTAICQIIVCQSRPFSNSRIVHHIMVELSAVQLRFPPELETLSQPRNERRILRPSGPDSPPFTNTAHSEPGSSLSKKRSQWRTVHGRGPDCPSFIMQNIQRRAPSLCKSCISGGLSARGGRTVRHTLSAATNFKPLFKWVSSFQNQEP
jgi:hypothetical protein